MTAFRSRTPNRPLSSRPFASRFGGPAAEPEMRPLVPDERVGKALLDAFGGALGLAQFIVAFIEERREELGYRNILDVASGDVRDQDGQELEERLPSLMEALAATIGLSDPWPVLRGLAAISGQLSATGIVELQTRPNYRGTFETLSARTPSTMADPKAAHALAERLRARLAKGIPVVTTAEAEAKA